MSKEAVRILMKSIDKSDVEIAPEYVTLDVSFIIRESCP